MKITEFNSPDRLQQIARVMESYFGRGLPLDQMSGKTAKIMLQRVKGLIREHKNTFDRHMSERNPVYLQLIMMEQALAQRVAETMPAPMPGAQPTQKPAAASAPTIDPNKLKAAQDKLSKGQTLSGDEQKLVNAAAAAQQQMQEHRLKRALRTLQESEVQQAQVVLAAQDMVDSIQGMIEDATEMQYKELPALVDSIRNQVGMDQANQFNTDATAALTGLVQSLQGTKQQMETSLSVVTGQQVAPALDAAMGAAPDAGAVPPPEAGAEPEADAMVTPTDLEAPVEPEAGVEPTATQLGREKR